MKTLSLKLQDHIFIETERVLDNIQQSRNGYINEALHFYNQLKYRQFLSKQFEYESKLGEDDSKEILAEFESLDLHLLDK